MNLTRAFAFAAVAGLSACAASPTRHSPEPAMFTAERVTEHRNGDDLLTAGLGIAGLRNPVARAFADPAHPTPVELRRRAIWSNWRGIADLSAQGGYGTLYGSTADVPGREFSAFARVAGAKQPHRVLVQVPDAFDANKRCVLVAPSSGSRGVYGAIAVAAAWGLPKGCAIAYTDKGTGTDYFDLDTRTGVTADGTRAGKDVALAFAPEVPAGASGVAFKHAHSQDNPEAAWGLHVRQAAEFALHALDQAFPQQAPFRFDNTRVIAVGISNGGGAVLRAAEIDGSGTDEGWLDAVVAGEPEVHVAKGRPLYDYGTQAALLMPCALLDIEGLPQSPLSAQARALGTVRCASLVQAGVIRGDDVAAQSRDAHALLRDSGWTDAALRAGALSVDFDLWRAVTVAYASAYGRYGAGEHPCGFRYSAQNADFTPRAANDNERAAWWSDATGIPPGNGVGIIDPALKAPDFTLDGLECLRGLWNGEDADARRVRKGIDETLARAPRVGLPVVVIHGSDDGLVPPAFSSAPYVAMAKSAGRDVRYWQVRNAQHFDAFLALPDYGARYVPLLPYVYAALDRVSAHLDDASAPLPADAEIATTARGTAALSAEHLAIP